MESQWSVNGHYKSMDKQLVITLTTGWFMDSQWLVVNEWLVNGT